MPKLPVHAQHNSACWIEKGRIEGILLIARNLLQHRALLFLIKSVIGLSKFDIIANIGLRPYFTQTAPQLGNNFFIHYLEMSDFSSILKNSSANISYQNIYDVGPNFPNQTICCFRTALHKNI